MLQASSASAGPPIFYRRIRPFAGALPTDPYQFIDARHLRSKHQSNSLHCSHIWTHPGLPGPVRMTARRITTVRIYTVCYMEDTYASQPGWTPRLSPQHFDDL